MRPLKLALFALVLLACKKDPPPQTTGGAPSTSAEGAKQEAKVVELSVEEVEQRLGASDKPVVLDANPREVYDKNHVPGAIWIPDEGVSEKLLPQDKKKPLIFYCASEH